MSIVDSISNVGMMYTAFPALSSKSTVTSAQLYYHLEGAAYEVIGKLSRRYSLPYAQSSGELHRQIANITCRLALQGFLEERAFTQERTNESEWPAEFDKQRDLLDKIADGAIPLVNNDGTIINGNDTQVQIWSNTSGYLPTFTEDPSDLNQDVDPDKINDIRLNRIR